MYWVEMLETGDAASMSPGTVNVLGGNVRHWDAASMSPGTVNVLGGNVRHWGRCQYVTRYRQCTGWKC